MPAPLDKLAHFVEYAVLGFLLCRGLGKSSWRWILALALAAFYGFIDELHQSFVPSREASGWDLLADGVGAFVGAWLGFRF